MNNIKTSRESHQ